jgi:hypothetical protein
MVFIIATNNAINGFMVLTFDRVILIPIYLLGYKVMVLFG